jgi:hypothetical protein
MVYDFTERLGLIKAGIRGLKILIKTGSEQKYLDKVL